jgi:hypothetical protein
VKKRWLQTPLRGLGKEKNQQRRVKRQDINIVKGKQVSAQKANRRKPIKVEGVLNTGKCCASLGRLRAED